MNAEKAGPFGAVDVGKKPDRGLVATRHCYEVAFSRQNRYTSKVVLIAETETEPLPTGEVVPFPLAYSSFDRIIPTVGFSEPLIHRGAQCDFS